MQSKSLKISLLLFFYAGFSLTAVAQDLHTYTDRDSVQVGDIINYSLVIQKDQDYESISFPDESHFDEDQVYLISRNRYRVSDRRDSVVYQLQFFGTDDFQISRFNVELTNSNNDTVVLSSNPVPLFFQSSVAEGDEQFRPLKPIFAFAAAIWPWLLLILVLVLVGWLIYRLRQAEEQPEPIPAPEPAPFDNPLHELRKELDALSGEDSPLRSRNYNIFYVRLGDAIRRYFENVYDLKALEMTSGEILRALRDYPAENKIISSTRQVLNEADMVKFARFEPDMDQAKHALEVAWQFIDVASSVDREKIRRLQDVHDKEQTMKMDEISS